MKKQIVFYIVWDLLFTIFLYAYSIVGAWAERSYYRGSAYLPFFVLILLPLIVGILFSWLIIISSQYQFTRKLAVLEFVLVGGLSLFFASIIVLPGLIFTLTGQSDLHLFTVWWRNATVPMTVGSILLGYELVMFIVRMRRCKKTNQPSESNQ